MRIGIHHPRPDKTLGCPVEAVAGEVPGKHVIFGFAGDNPLGQHGAKAAGLGEAGDDTVAAVVVFQFRHRSEQRCRVRRPDHRPVDHPFHTGIAEGRHAFAGAHVIGLDTLKIIGEEFMAEIEWCSFLGPEFTVLFIGTNQETQAFLAHVVFAVTIGDRWQAAADFGNFRHGLGYEILVFGRLQGQVDTSQLSNLARPKSGGIDHNIGMDGALVGDHKPGTIGLLAGAGDGAEALDAAAHFARPSGIGHGDAGRVHIAAVLLEHDAADTVKIDERVFLFSFLAAEFIELHAKLAGLGALQAQLVFAIPSLGKIKRTGLEHAAGLAGFLFQLLVELHRVILQLGDVVVVMQAVQVGCSMPGGAGSQFIALQQDNVLPAQLAQVVED